MLAESAYEGVLDNVRIYVYKLLWRWSRLEFM